MRLHSKLPATLLLALIPSLLMIEFSLVQLVQANHDDMNRIQQIRGLLNVIRQTKDGTCPTTNRCGIDNLDYPMYLIQTSGGCRDACVSIPSFFLKAGYRCGTCADLGPVAPPVPRPTLAPIEVPTPTSQQRLCTARDPRCYYGLAYQQYRGVQDTIGCEEICSFNPILQEDFDGCGYCNSQTSLSPIAQPSPVSPVFPTAPVTSPSLPIDASTLSPIASPVAATALPINTPVVSTALPTAPTITGSPVTATNSPTANGSQPSVPIDATPLPTILIDETPSPTVASPIDIISPAPVETPLTSSPTQQAPIDNGGGDDDGYQITLDLQMSVQDVAMFQAATARWESIITGDVPDVESATLSSMPREGCSYPTIIDDLYICGVYEKIDGAGNQVGYGTVTNRRRDSKLPVTGDMLFDVEDLEVLLNSNLFDALILHEMGHVLGIGTIWTDVGIQGPPVADCPYSGSTATAEFNVISGCDSIPIEQTGGDGTRCKHWSESCLGAELMTGQLNFPDNPLSRITIGSLADVGYVVSYDSADDFTADQLNKTDSTCFCNRRREMRDLMENENGKVFALRNEKSDKSLKVGLPPEIHKLAVERGNRILDEAAEKTRRNLHTMNERTDQESDDNLEYVGDVGVSVLWLHEGNIYSIIVSRSLEERYRSESP